MKGINPSEIRTIIRIAFGGEIAYSAVNELWTRFQRGEIFREEFEEPSRDPEK